MQGAYTARGVARTGSCTIPRVIEMAYPSRAFIFVALALTALASLAAAGCGGSTKSASDHAMRATGGPTRPFMMGISTLPRELNGEAYDAAFGLAAENGEAVLIQRTPPWEDFVPGAAISDATTRTTADEKRAIAEHRLRLFFAIDPTDGATGRDRLAGLPNALAGRDFSDPDIRGAFVAYAHYVALNYRPAYMALGVDMNLYYQKNRDDFEHFRTLYQEARDVVKAASPETQVTVTFQYEDLQGLMKTEQPHFPDWQLVQQFDPLVDVVAISTYPSLGFARAADIPANYYSQLRGFTDRPIVIAEMGYSSALGARGVNDGTEQDQRTFLERALRDAETLQMPLVIWFAAWDPAYARDTPLGVFEHIGLRRADDTEKPAWAIWREAARRPYAPG